MGFDRVEANFEIGTWQKHSFKHAGQKPAGLIFMLKYLLWRFTDLVVSVGLFSHIMRWASSSGL